VCPGQHRGPHHHRELAEEALRNFLPSTPPSLTIEAIQREVASYFGVKLHDLKGPKRHRAVSHPRMVAMYLARRLTSMSYPENRQPLRWQGPQHGHQRRSQDRASVRHGPGPAERDQHAESHLRQVMALDASAAIDHKSEGAAFVARARPETW
jgi:chromosomal replication initiator protein